MFDWDIYLAGPAALKDSIDALLSWLDDGFPLTCHPRRMYQLTVWPSTMLGLCSDHGGPHAEVLFDRSNPEEGYHTICHEMRHLIQLDQGLPFTDRGVDSWAAARVREAKREGII